MRTRHTAIRAPRIAGLVVLTMFVAGLPATVAGFDVDFGQLVELTPPAQTLISRANVDSLSYLLDRDVAAMIRRGWFTMIVGEPTSFRPHSAYVQATRAGEARLGGPGTLENYRGGRPFPNDPAPSDTRAGEKIAWNMRLMYSGDSGLIPEMYLQLRDLNSETLIRSLTLEARSMRFMYRHVVAPIPSVNKNLQNALGAFYMRAVEAGDLTGAEVLAFFNRDDSEPRNGWVYIPQLRRSQSLASFPPRETVFGSDILPDDFLGYAGRIVDMTWKYIGSSYLLMPMYRHDQIVVTEKIAHGSTYRFAHFAGRAACFPAITWQVRRVHLVEGTPVSSDGPVTKRLLYIDAQTAYAGLVKLYDEDGNFWKLVINGVAHPNSHVPVNHETAAPVIDSASTIDVINGRCTTVQLYLTINVDGVNVRDFDPADLGAGRRARR